MTRSKRTFVVLEPLRVVHVYEVQATTKAEAIEKAFAHDWRNAPDIYFLAGEAQPTGKNEVMLGETYERRYWS